MTEEPDTRETAIPLATLGAAVAVLVALAGLVIAWATDFALCLDEDVCERRSLRRGQLVLAIVDTGIAVALLVFALRRMRRASIAGGIAFVAGFAACAVLGDAVTHGWDELWLLPG